MHLNIILIKFPSLKSMQITVLIILPAFSSYMHILRFLSSYGIHFQRAECLKVLLCQIRMQDFILIRASTQDSTAEMFIQFISIKKFKNGIKK